MDGPALDEMVLEREREPLVSLVSGCFFFFFAKNAPCILYGERYALGDIQKPIFSGSWHRRTHFKDSNPKRPETEKARTFAGKMIAR